MADSNTSGGPAPLDVFFSGTATDLDGNIVKYEWDFDGDENYDWESPDTANVRHIYPTAGTYTARLQATDNEGYTGTDTLTITVTQSPPTAEAGAAPLQGNASLVVDFTGAGADDDGSIVLYEWDFDGDTNYEYSSADTPVVSHSYTSAGTYDATFRVTDNDGLTATDTVTIDVLTAGMPSAAISAFPTHGVSPLSVSLCPVGNDPDGTISNYELDYEGDGTYDFSSTSPFVSFSDNMESGIGTWTLQPPWGQTTSSSHSPTTSWTESPGGNYPINTDTEWV